MALPIYRRHSSDCQFVGRHRHDSRSQKCGCPIWVQGSLGREYLRESLNLTSWQADQVVGGLKPIKVPPTQTLPFDDSEVEKILAAGDRFSLKGIYGDRRR